MSIIQLPTPIPGTQGQLPSFKFMVVTDDLTTLTTAGYLNQVSLEGYPVSTTDIIQILYGFNTTTNVGTYTVCSVSIANGIITLVEDVTEGGVLLPVVSGNFPVFNGTTGQIKDGGQKPSNPAYSNVPTVAPGPANTYMAVFQDDQGTIGPGSSGAVNPGNVQAGLSGTAGTLASFPSTAAKGSLKIAAVANTGNTVTTISNAAMGQASVVSIPDPAGATANFALAPSALVSGNLVKASGTAGLLVDAGVSTSGSYLILGVSAKTASLTHTQAGATLLTTQITNLTVANAGDTIVLPPAVTGMFLIVMNASANTFEAYGNGNDTINGTAGSSGSVTMAASKTTNFYCVSGNTWRTGNVS